MSLEQKVMKIECELHEMRAQTALPKMEDLKDLIIVMKELNVQSLNVGMLRIDMQYHPVPAACDKLEGC